jgi:hypothetical protein
MGASTNIGRRGRRHDHPRVKTMTVHEFIEQLFSRPQSSVASNMRNVSPGQLELLRELIGPR